MFSSQADQFTFQWLLGGALFTPLTRQYSTTRTRVLKLLQFHFHFHFRYHTPHFYGAVDPKSRMLGVVYNWSLEADLNKIARTDSGSYYSINSNNAPFRSSFPVIATIT